MNINKKECLDIFERYILRKASAEDVERLQLYILEDQQLNDWLEGQIKDSSDEIDISLKLQLLENIRSEIDKSKFIGKQTIISLKWLFRAAAIIILPLITAVGVYTYMKPNQVEPLIVCVEAGEKANLVLPDGSKVWLNSSSKLTYYNNYNDKERLLELNGEAYFEVKANSEKPFIVECVDLKVEVLGTTFGIKAYNEDDVISAVLNTGRIKAITPDEVFILSPNKQITYDRKSKKAHQSDVKATDYTSWRHNRLRFENEPLQEIAKTISRIHNVDIVFENQNIKNQKFTGTIDNTNIETVLRAISLTSPIAYKVKDSTIILYEDKRNVKFFNNE